MAVITAEVEPVKKELQIKVVGKFDLQASKEFIHCYRQASPPIKLCSVDLTEADSIDSTGLGALLQLRDDLSIDSQNIYIKTTGNKDMNTLLHKVQYHRIFNVV
jgi:anti-anti-sigma regulatory factor